MSRQTELLINPTLDEVKRQAAVINLPAREAEKFYYYWESVGWKRGRVKLKCWKSAMQTWRLNWEDRRVRDVNEQEAKECRRGLTRALNQLDQGKL